MTEGIEFALVGVTTYMWMYEAQPVNCDTEFGCQDQVDTTFRAVIGPQ